MKKLCIIILILFTVPLCSFAPNKKVSIIDIWETKPICRDIMLEYRKVKILNAIIKIEKPRTLQQAKDAYKRELAVGILQIRPVMVDEVNRILGYRKYSHYDAADSTKAVEMFFIYQDRYNSKYLPNKAAYLWVAGSNYNRATTTQWKNINSYWNRVKTYLK